MKIKNNKVDWTIEILCLTMLVGLTGYLLLNWRNIPNQIPAHYDWYGNIERWGSKSELLIVPIMAWILYLVITGLEQIPLIWNTGVQVTEENKERIYRVLKNMIKSLKLIMVADFTYMTIMSLMERPLSEWFTFIILVLVFGDLIFWIIKLAKVK